MIYSMTGYGRNEFPLGDKNIIIEIKSLNGKQLDINCKLSPQVKPYEYEIRKLIQEKLIRGSVDCNIMVLQSGSSKPVQVNTQLIQNYYQSISSLAESLNIEQSNILPAVLSLPEVVSTDPSVLEAGEWKQLSSALDGTLETLVQFRQTEGDALEKDLLLREQNIQNALTMIEGMDKSRNEKIRERIVKSLQSLGEELKIDENRLEQELIYYIEKIDISEEKQRLAQHCHLFKETILQATNSGTGKKLNFILQEMGREINTLGSKAYDANIQKIIIDMKDELEKAKEQSLNVL
ncbi:MAG: YicC family protein [Taibaiella sp.]|nr:YicC family protein [Taibaiella sp.]